MTVFILPPPYSQTPRILHIYQIILKKVNQAFSAPYLLLYQWAGVCYCLNSSFTIQEV
jgi:hypothetical protein